MSYNIDSVDALVLDAWMYALDVARVIDQYGDECPEVNFLDALKDVTLSFLNVARPIGDPGGFSWYGTAGVGERIALKSFCWYGAGSGHSYTDVLIKYIAPLIHGRVEAVFTWEGGDSLTGLIIEDGKVTECDVVQTLRPKKTKV